MPSLLQPHTYGQVLYLGDDGSSVLPFYCTRRDVSHERTISDPANNSRVFADLFGDGKERPRGPSPIAQHNRGRSVAIEQWRSKVSGGETVTGA